MTAQTDYQIIRNATAVHTLGAPLVRLTGDDRLEFLDGFLSKSSDFVDPDTTRECLALEDDGRPFAIMLHLELDEVSWLVPRNAVSVGELVDYLGTMDVPDGVTVEVAPSGWRAIAFEGAGAWRVAEDFIDYDISGLVLHGITEITIPGADRGTSAVMARVSTSGEYGYLVITDAVDIAELTIAERARALGGAVIDDEALARVEAEAGTPHYAFGVRGHDLTEMDLSWLIDWNRIGEFRGSDALTAPTREQRRLVPFTAPAGSRVEPSSPVLADGQRVGEVLYVTPPANPDEELGFAIVEAPFWVPGLELTLDGEDGLTIRTVTLPRVLARSSVERMA
ncbi:MAG: aminomethyl transferase family protein [Propionibacterium acidifaciens]